MTDDLAFTSATDLVESYRAKRISPVEATRAVLDRIDKHDEALNAYVMVDHEAALAAARESEARWKAGEPKGLVDGVPTSIKDLVLTKGWPTLRGSRTVDPDQPWDEDAPSVARLREHGAVLLGKTTTPEFGHKGVTDSMLTGITRNPWDQDKTPGGSSGGASASVAAGMGPLAIGTDAGGSIRIPASFGGIYGLKPTFGRVPAYPSSPFGTLAHVGPMTRNVADAALMLTVIAEPDWRDWSALPYDGQDYREEIEADVRGLRVAYSPALGRADAKVDAEVAALVAAAAKTFEEMGAVVEQVDPEWPESLDETFMTYFASGAAKLISMFTEAQKAKVEPTLMAVVEAGATLTGLQLKDAELERSQLGMTINGFFEQHDLLLSPTLPMPAFEVGRAYPTPEFKAKPYGWIPFTYPINLSKHPAASIPCGFTEAGLPVGLQIVGPMYGELSVLHASRAFEKAAPFQDRRPVL
ncbi:MAG: amidase [Alphaproteobacteria bacterium]|jgi:aspartyl-tRNA(Asn)/glutamyl-tRNA(Gln) amidotransferase subunit A|nr:amidase [Alphaproteobacteria bacterium]MDP6517031.1 amidase [Alphaproteobacteria bacterium]